MKNVYNIKTDSHKTLEELLRDNNDDVNIYKMSATELRKIAKEKHMPGAWKATKLEMLAYLDESINNESEIAQNDAQDVVETVNDKVIDDTENVTQNEPETNEEQPENNNDDVNIYKMSATELRKIAKEKHMPGAWKATKLEMLAYLDESINNESEIAQNDAQDVVETVNDKVIDDTENVTQNEPETNEELLRDNGWELIAKQQLNNAYNWLVGERENSVNDGEMTDEEFNEWIANQALEEIYHEAITTKYHKDACGGKAPKEMRFAGKNFCYKYLTKLFKQDGYNVDKPTEKKQKGKDLIEYDGRVQNLSQWAKELGIPGQTLFARIHISRWTVEKAFTTSVKKRKKEEVIKDEQSC